MIYGVDVASAAMATRLQEDKVVNIVNDGVGCVDVVTLRYLQSL